MDKRNLIKVKWFIMGVLATLMLSGTALMAGPVMREIVFGVSVTLDGETIQFEEDMRPFLMGDRAFLPVRAIAEIAGLYVDFDGATNTVVLTTEGTAAVTDTQAHAGHQLVGTWAWDISASYEYVFNADGTGTRGVAPLLESIRWRTGRGGHLIIETQQFVESWTYVINGDVLTLTSRQVDGMEFSYFRVTPDTAVAADETNYTNLREFFEANPENFQERVNAMESTVAIMSAEFGLEMTAVLEIVGDHTLRFNFIYGPDTVIGPTMEANLAVGIGAMTDFQTVLAQELRREIGVETLYKNIRYLDSTGRVLAEGTFAGH